LPQWFFLMIVVALGLAFGSFANVVIWRFPRGESLSNPPSHCPTCDAPILSRDNVPVLSWLLLRGRCRNCGSAISARYPVVESLTGLLWLAAALAYGQSARFLFAAVFFYLLLILSFIDLDTMRLPNPMLALLAVFGIAGTALSVVLDAPCVPLVPAEYTQGPVISVTLGVLLGSGISAGIAFAYYKWRGTQGFGVGDVKLLAVMGVFLGPYVLFSLFTGSVLGACYGVAAMKWGSAGLRTKFPFGPFLAVGAVATALFGPQVWEWYIGLVG
jgi:leader peptidase (prepilin peptidase)/N-methyltransferase